MTNETANVIGDFTSNVAASAAWDFAKFAIFKLLPASIIMTTLSRIGRKVFGKRPLDKTKEIAFWSLGIIGGTIVLAGICMAYSYPMERIAAQERIMFSAMMKNQAPPRSHSGESVKGTSFRRPHIQRVCVIFLPASSKYGCANCGYGRVGSDSHIAEQPAIRGNRHSQATAGRILQSIQYIIVDK